MRTWWIPLTSIGLLLTLRIDAAAYCLNIPQGLNKEVSWQTLPVTYQVSDNLTDAAILQAIDDAFATWEAVPCSALAFTKGAQFTMCTETDMANCAANTVHPNHGTPYINIFWYTDSTGFPAATNSAIFNQTWYGMAGTLEGATIAINAFTYGWNATGGDTQTLDVQNEMTYLIGSVIGLTKSTVAGATMYMDSLKFGDTERRSLEQDDMDGVVHLYKEANCSDPPPPDPTCTSSIPPVDGGTPTVDGGTATGDGGTSPQTDGGGGTADSGTATGDSAVPWVDGGTSGKECTSSDQCGEGEFCTAEGFCKKEGGDDGCCRVGHEPRGNLPLMLLLLTAGLLLLRLGRPPKRG